MGRTASHRNALFSNLATALFRHGRIKTTLAKSKELRGVVDRLIGTAKVDTVHARRMVARVIRDKEIVKKLFQDIVPGFSDRNSGYTQIFQLGTRLNDGAPMSFIQLVGYTPPEEEK